MVHQAWQDNSAVVGIGADPLGCAGCRDVVAHVAAPSQRRRGSYNLISATLYSKGFHLWKTLVQFLAEPGHPLTGTAARWQQATPGEMPL